MKNPAETRHCVVAELRWLIETPTSSPTAGLTCYRAELGLNDLFSVFVKFESPQVEYGTWQKAKIFALVEELEARLPSVGGELVLTAGVNPVAIAKVVSKCAEPI